MKGQIVKTIKKFVSDYESESDIQTHWREPIVKFADSKDETFKKLKEVVNEDHLMPEDLLQEAETVIAYFIPFKEPIPDTNIKGKYSSREWALAYIETNQLIDDLNQHIKDFLKEKGYDTAVTKATHNFSEKTLMSYWSHRHAAYIAGIGTFGINNMLITEAGVVGRVGTLVTDLKIEPDERVKSENCLYKHNGTCGVCIEKCQFGALTFEGFDRHRCYEICLENDEYHDDLSLTDICGKCCVGLPCSYINPTT